MSILKFVELLSDDDMERFHNSILDLLEDPGMKIEAPGLLSALKKKGATVDFGQEIVRFPRQLVEETIRIAAREERERLGNNDDDIVQATKSLTFSWHTAFPNGVPGVKISFGGGCPLYYDYPSNNVRESTIRNFLDMLYLAEGLPEVATVGNVVHCIRDFNGERISPKMVSIKGAALVAKHSSKPGSTSLMYAEQLDYLIEIGTVIRGTFQNYRMRPLFININDTIPPLRLSRPEGAIIEALIKKRLPVFILPMPLMGVSGPVTPLSNAIIGAAEILGIWTAAKAVDPEVPVECSIVSGVMEPHTGSVCFSGPETVLQDVTVAQLFRKRYRLRCGVGAGFIDAPIPGLAAAYERTLKCILSASCGEFAYPVGILAAGNIFSPEQAMIDKDIAFAGHRFFRGPENDFDEALMLIREQGIGGMFFNTDHTCAHFRDQIWIPQVFDRSKSKDPKETKCNDAVRIAYEKWTDILQKTTPYEIGEDKKREIDRIVKTAEKHLIS